MFAAPAAVLDHPRLLGPCKREILRRWAWDEYLKEVAAAEGMAEGEPSQLEAVKAALLALGERWFGVGRTTDTFAAIQTGEGVGAGIVLQGRLYPSDGVMSEAGHTCVDIRGERCRCGKRGCWETIATRRWLRARTESFSKRPTLDEEGLAEFAETAARTRGPEFKVLKEYARNIAVGLSNMALVLGIRSFVLYGDAAVFGEELRALVEAETRTRMAPEVGVRVDVLLADRAGDAGILGVAASIIQRHFRLSA